MKNIIKKTFSNMVWWSGVVTVGVMFGVVLQFVSAWTDPTGEPGVANVTGPINTSSVEQLKNGVLGAVGLYTRAFRLQDGNQEEGKILVSDDDGDASWASSGPFIPTDVKATSSNHNGNFGGYDAMYNWIQSNGCEGYHVCSVEEIQRYHALPDKSVNSCGFVWGADGKWSSGAQEYIDGNCRGWTNSGDNAQKGIIWRGSGCDSGDQPYEFHATNCDKSRAVMCCK